jgi:hypothetical protein
MARVKVDARDLAEGTCPPVCVRCGTAAAYSRTITVSHADEGNPGVGCLVGSLLGSFAGALVSRAAAADTARITVPVCPTHARPRGLPNERGESQIGLLMFGVVVVMLFGVLLSQEFAVPDFVMVVWIFGGLTIIIMVGLAATRCYTRHIIRAAEITDRYVVLTNVSHEFARAVEAQQEADRQAKLARLAGQNPEPPAAGG